MPRRLVPSLVLALLVGLLVAPGAPSSAAIVPSSVGSLGAEMEGDLLLVGGRATFGGVMPAAVATDPAGDFALPQELGYDLVGAWIGQPKVSTGDLELTLRVAELPARGGLPEAARYIWDFGVAGLGADPVPFQVEGKLTDVLRRQSTRMPSFVLRGDCSTANNVTTCASETAVDAVMDVEAAEIRVRVPRRLLEEQLNAPLEGTSIVAADICEGISAKLSAHSSLCNGQGEATGDIMLQDRAYPVATPVVRVAVAARGESPDFGQGVEATLGSHGAFTAAVDATGISDETHDAWAQACFGTNCGIAGVPLGTERVELLPTWNPPVLVHATQAHRETSLAISPTDPNLRFVCDPSGVPNTANNQSYFHRSTNGGTSWTPVDVEGSSTSDLRNYAFEGGDCDVAFDEGGTMYSADTWLGNLSIGHSFDGGATWQGTPLAASVPVVDRPWLVGGPEGTIHVSYQDLQCCTPSAIWYTRSDDYGQTFLPATPVAQAGANGAFTWEGNFVVSPGGRDLYLVYTRRQGPALGSLDAQGPETVWVAASHDAGVTWTSHQVASMPNPASYLYPSIAMDAAGYLHVVFASRTSEDRPIWYAFSDDGAETWSEPTPITRGGSGYSPWVAGGGAGEAAVVWLGSPHPNAVDNAPFDWFFYTARIAGADEGAPVVEDAGPTTTDPMFTGVQYIPEFEMIRLDDAGMIHIGMSIYRRSGATTRWAIYYQSQSLQPAT